MKQKPLVNGGPLWFPEVGVQIWELRPRIFDLSLFSFTFRRPDPFIHGGKEFGAFFDILSVKPITELGTLCWRQLLDRSLDFS